jgi:sulfatase maturation enzyme AslB (radical SAM superfamily)
MMNKPVTFSELLNPADNHHCVHPWADLWINTAGHVTCCPQNRTRFGNIHQNSLAELWNSEAAQSVRKLVADNDYRAAGCETECPFLRGTPTAPHLPPPAEELINLDFKLPSQASALAENIATVASEYKDKKQYLSGFPIYVDTQPILRCNSDCTMCNQPHLSDLEHSDAILQKIESLKETAKVFRWQGGEVFTNKRFFNYLKQFDSGNNSELIKYVITNGSLLTEDRIKVLTDSENPVFFLISIDGVKKQTFEKIRIGLNYERVMACLHTLSRIQAENKQGRKLVCWNYVVMSSTLDDMHDAIDLAAKLNVDLNFAALQGDFPEENIFHYPLHDVRILLDKFSHLKTYSDTKSIKVSGFDGLIYRVKQRIC